MMVGTEKAAGLETVTMGYVRQEKMCMMIDCWKIHVPECLTSFNGFESGLLSANTQGKGRPRRRW